MQATGARAYERFTGMQIAKIIEEELLGFIKKHWRRSWRAKAMGKPCKTKHIVSYKLVVWKTGKQTIWVMATLIHIILGTAPCHGTLPSKHCLRPAVYAKCEHISLATRWKSSPHRDRSSPFMWFDLADLMQFARITSKTLKQICMIHSIVDCVHYCTILNNSKHIIDIWYIAYVFFNRETFGVNTKSQTICVSLWGVICHVLHPFGFLCASGHFGWFGHQPQQLAGNFGRNREFGWTKKAQLSIAWSDDMRSDP